MSPSSTIRTTVLTERQLLLARHSQSSTLPMSFVSCASIDMDAEMERCCQKRRRVQTEVTVTLRDTPYTYLQLSVTSIDRRIARHPLDPITARTYLTSALSQYLGLTGTAIPIDILKVADQNFWVRVPKEDASAMIAAVGQWTNASVGVSLKIEG